MNSYSILFANRGYSIIAQCEDLFKITRLFDEENWGTELELYQVCLTKTDNSNFQLNHDSYIRSSLFVLHYLPEDTLLSIEHV